MNTTAQSQKRLGLILLALGLINESQLTQLIDENAKHVGERYGETAIRMGFVTSEQTIAVLDVQVLKGRLGAILAALGYVTKEQCDTLLTKELQPGERIGQAAVRTGLISTEQLTRALCVQQIIQRKLGQILVALGFISKEQHTRVIEENLRRKDEKFGETAVALGFVSDEQIIKSVEVQQLDGRLGSILVALGDISREQRDIVVSVSKQRKGLFGDIAQWLGFVNNRQFDKAVKVQRRLQMETLEARQMMSVNPLGIDNFDNEDTDNANEYQSDSPAYYALQTSGTAEDNDVDKIAGIFNALASEGNDTLNDHEDTFGAGDNAEKVADIFSVLGSDGFDTLNDHDHDHDGDDHEDFPVYDEKIATQYRTDNQQDAGTVTQNFETALTPTSFNLNDTFKLHSKADAKLTIYIDFTGYTCTDSYWTSSNGGKAIIVPAWSLDSDHNNFSDAELQQIYYIWQRVAEDYAPFDVDVTTEKPSDDRLMKTSSNDTDYGIHVVVDDNSTHWYGNAGGVAGVGTFTSSIDRVAWVFADQLQNKEKTMAEAISHEVGHTLGLYHDGAGSTTYYQGANGWAPIMGTGYYQDVTQFSKGEYAGASNTEDDLAIINKKLAYRADDHGNTFATATKIDTANGTLKSFGIIEKNTDVDVFQFSLDKAWTLDINIKSGMRDANLDILAKLCAADGTVIAVSDSPDTMNAAFKISLGPGNYYITIEGTGKVVNGKVIYTDYGSLGTYTVSGTLKENAVTAPSAPANFAVAERTDRTVSLSWTQQNNVTGYTLQYRPAGSNAGWTTVSVAANATSVKVNGLDAKTNYEFQLTATNAGGSATSALTGLTNAAAPTAPVLNIVGSTTNTVTLNWNAQSDVASYILQYRAAGANEWVTTVSPAGDAVGVTISGLKDGTNYEFQLTAINVSGSVTASISAGTKVDTTAAEAAVTAAKAVHEEAVAVAAKEAQKAIAAQENAAAKQAIADDAANAANVAANTATDKVTAADNAAKAADTAAVAASNATEALTAAETVAAKEAAEAETAKTVAEQAAQNKAAAEKAVADAQAAVAQAEAMQITAPTNLQVSKLSSAASAAALASGQAKEALAVAKAAGTFTNLQISKLSSAASAAALASGQAKEALAAAKASQVAAADAKTSLTAAQETLAKAQALLNAADVLQKNADQMAMKEAAEAQAAQSAADAARQMALASANESKAAAERSVVASTVAAEAIAASKAAASTAQTAAKEATAALADAAREIAAASAAQKAAEAAEKTLADATATLEALR